MQSATSSRYPKHCAATLLGLLLLNLVPTRSAQAAQPGVVATTTSTDPKALSAVQMVNANFAFIAAVQAMHPPPAWLARGSRTEFEVLQATPKTLQRPEFALVKPALNAHGPFYVANVYAKGDRRRQPLYLYLLAGRGSEIEIVRALHKAHGEDPMVAH